MCPHFQIKIRQRSKGQSAISAAAYQSGERLHSAYDGKIKNYCYKKKEVFAKGILLPPHIPKKFSDRETLWNAVELGEKPYNAQLARGIIIALPRELPSAEWEPLVRDFCESQFVSKGMIADYAIHDKGDGNPHIHILLTMRAMDEQGNWLPKAKKVYDLDEDGNRIRLSGGAWKSHKENTVDWNDHRNAEIWRSAWADTVNRYFEKNRIDERLDLRSYERQGKEEIPTVHLGAAVAHMEEKGIPTEIGEYNRRIQAFNRKLRELRHMLSALAEWFVGVRERMEEIRKSRLPPLQLLDLICLYRQIRDRERIDSDMNAYQRNWAHSHEAQTAIQIMSWMRLRKIPTVDAFEQYAHTLKEKTDTLSDDRKRIRQLDFTLKHIETVNALYPVFAASKRGFQKERERYANEHKEEIGQFLRAYRYLQVNHVNRDLYDQYAAEREQLKQEERQLSFQVRREANDIRIVNEIRKWVDYVLKQKEIPLVDKKLREQMEVWIEKRRKAREFD